MSITEAQVAHIAALARLALDTRASSQIADELNRILHYINNLNKLDVDDVPPTSHALDPQANVLRDDHATAGLPNSLALAAAPAEAGGLFKVPRVVEL